MATTIERGLNHYPEIPMPESTTRRIFGRYRQQHNIAGNTAGDAGDLVEELTYFGTGWCEEGCLWLPAWGELATTRQLRGALAIAYHFNPAWRPFARAAVERGVTIAWEELDPMTGGHYIGAKKRVELNSALQEEPGSVLAAVMAHELVHAARLVTSKAPAPGEKRTPAICFKEELLAWAWEASTWLKVRKGTEQTGLARSFDRLAEAWRNHRLQEWVLLSATYQRQCLGESMPVL